MLTPEDHKAAILDAAQNQALAHAEAMETPCPATFRAFDRANVALTEAVDALKTALEAAQADQKRYQWLREHPALAQERWEAVWLSPEEIDAAIDATMASQLPKV